MRKAGITEEDGSTEVPPHSTSQTSQLLLPDLKQVLLGNTGLSRMARLSCPKSALPAGRGTRPRVLGCVCTEDSLLDFAFTAGSWRLKGQQSQPQLAPRKPCLCQSGVSTVAERGYGMDEKIRVERGALRKDGELGSCLFLGL